MKRAAIVGIAVAGAVVVAGAGAAWWFLSRGPSAEDAARSYLGALAGGDLEVVQAMREPLTGQQQDVLEQAFRGAAAYIADPRVEEVKEQDGGAVEVRASAEVGGERRDLAFSLERDDGGWTVAADGGTLTVDAALEGGSPLAWVLVGGAPAPVATPLPLLPAEYVVAAAPGSILQGSVDIAMDTADATASVTASVAPEASARVQEQLDAYADACAEPATTVPAHCGMVVPWAADLASLERIAFRIEEYPVAALAPDAASFDATGGVLVATAHGTAHDGSEASFTYRADDWSLRGSVVLDGDHAVLAVR